MYDIVGLVLGFARELPANAPNEYLAVCTKVDVIEETALSHANA